VNYYKQQQDIPIIKIFQIVIVLMVHIVLYYIVYKNNQIQLNVMICMRKQLMKIYLHHGVVQCLLVVNPVDEEIQLEKQLVFHMEEQVQNQNEI